MTIIKLEPLESGQHPIQSQSGRIACWIKDWIEVPAHLEAAVWATLGWCDLNIEDGHLVSITPTEHPEAEPEPEVPTQEERIAALESAMLAMMMEV